MIKAKKNSPARRPYKVPLTYLQALQSLQALQALKEYRTPTPSMMPVTMLQCTAVSFVPAILYSYKKSLWLGMLVLSATTVSTLYVHRVDRPQPWERADLVDWAAVWAWVLYNTVLTATTCVSLMSAFDGRRAGCLLAAVACGVCVGLLDRWRCRFRFRSPERNMLHGLMHVCGGLGTLLLLYMHTQ